MQIKLRDFESQILYFNGMYKLPVAAFPSTGAVVLNELAKLPPDSKRDDRKLTVARLEAFKKTLLDELMEVDDIIYKIKRSVYQHTLSGKIEAVEYAEIDFLVDMADWLGDIQVYCASEMAKYGIPLKETLSIIMSSNFSKLDLEGNPIYDAHGKVLKGPAYWKPEPRIKEMLEEHIAAKISAKVEAAKGIVWRNEG
jgi:hypothetical protein